MIKNLLTNILFLVALSSFGQLNQKSDTISAIPVLVNDSTSILSNDSIPVLPIKESTDSVAKPLLEAIITYSAADSIIPDFENQKMYMYKNAVINYQNIELKADYIMLDSGQQGSLCRRIA